MKFSELDLRDELRRAMDDAGFVDLTPIQELVIRPALGGGDILGVARTGSGKTLAFLLPIFQRLEPCGEVQAVIVCPTRELALQVGEVAESLGSATGARTAVLYGGTSLGHQRQALLAGLDVVVGTPGRLLDFMGSAYLRTRKVRWLVLDEADRMLDMGFIDDVEAICAAIPMSRQTMLFSATLPPEIAAITERFMFHPQEFRVATRVEVPPGIEQVVYRVARRDKERALLAVLRREKPEKALVFTATREATSELATRVRETGSDVISLSSLLSQANRERAVQAFRDGKSSVMVATDVAGRGLDITDISHVINFDLPTVAEDYVHRIGRTGRMERAGRAISLVCPEDDERLRDIERILPEPVPRGRLEGFDEPEPGRRRGRGRDGRRRSGKGRGTRGRGGGGRGGDGRGGRRGRRRGARPPRPKE